MANLELDIRVGVDWVKFSERLLEIERKCKKEAVVVFCLNCLPNGHIENDCGTGDNAPIAIFAQAERTQLQIVSLGKNFPKNYCNGKSSIPNLNCSCTTSLNSFNHTFPLSFHVFSHHEWLQEPFEGSSLAFSTKIPHLYQSESL